MQNFEVENNPIQPLESRSMLLGVLLLFVRAMAGAYTLSVSGYLLLYFTIGESWPLIGVLNSFLHLLLLPSLILLPIALIRRRGVLIVLLIPQVIAFGVWYGPYLLPKDIAPPDSEQTVVRLATFNLHGLQAADGLEAVIRAMDAGIVAVQELSEESAEILSAALADLYPEQALHPVPGRPRDGKGTFSRYAITESAFDYRAAAYQRAVLEIEGMPVELYNVHLFQPFAPDRLEMRRDDINLLLAMALLDDDPFVLLAGDFNLTDRSDGYRMLTTPFRDAFAVAGQGLGHTFMPWDGLPLARIDYVFYRSGWRAIEVTVWPVAGGSDHRPVVVEMALQRAPADD